MKTAKEQTFIRKMCTDGVHRIPYLLLTFMLVFGLGLISCEGPAGSQGEQGQQGEQGLVGPAGEDGSMMFAGEGPPAAETGNEGDYYLDQNTGELYGPKNSDGWDDPIIVLKGDDGEDGSQIYAGNGAPDASLGANGDYYLDKANFDLYGPKNSSGWGSPLNLKGADGNANVQSFDMVVRKADWSDNFHYGGNNNYRYYKIPTDSTGGVNIIDFYSAGNAVLAYARLLSEGTYQTEFLNVKQLPLLTTVTIGGLDKVGVRIQLSPTRSEFLLNRTTNGFNSLSIFDEQVPPTTEFRIVLIEATNTTSNKANGQMILSELKVAGVDLNDYHAVMDYFGAGD